MALLQPFKRDGSLYKEGAGLKLLPPQKGLTLNWDMENVQGTTLYDRTQNGNNGTNTNITQDLGTKDLNSSVCFNGISAVTKILSFFNFTDIKYSYEIWFKVFSGFAYTSRLAFAYGGSNRGFIVTYNANKTLEIVSHGGQITTTETFDDDKWHHLIVSENNGQLEITIDNSIKYSNSHTFTAFDTTATLSIGASSVNTLFWKGCISTLRVWKNTILTEKEITYLYNNGYGIK